MTYINSNSILIARSNAVQLLDNLISEGNDVLNEKNESSQKFQFWQSKVKSCVRTIYGGNSHEAKDIEKRFEIHGFAMPIEIDSHKLYIGRVNKVISDLNGYKYSISSVSEETSSASAIDNVLFICRRFQHLIRPLRNCRNKKNKLEIEDEYDVQYLMNILLSLFFDDIRPEEYTPSCGPSNSRIDFLIKDEYIAVETKMTRNGLKDRDVMEQLLIDISYYKQHPDVKVLCCFIFDPQTYLVNPAAIIKGLEEQSGVDFEVKVVISNI